MAREPRRHSFLAFDPSGFHRIAYNQWGDPRARHVVICVHGLTRNSRDFDVLAGQLARRCQVVCMDVAGRGESDWLTRKQDYGFPLYLADAATLIALTSHAVRRGPVSAFVERLRGGPRPPFIDWVGTSMGGLIGMMLASKPNSPIRRLVLNDIGPFVSWQALSDLKGMLTRRAGRFDDLAEVEAWLREVCVEFGPLADHHWQHVARHSVEALPDGGYALAWDPEIVSSLRLGGNSQGIDFGSDFLFGVDLWPVWNAVSCPTLVLRGDRSAVLSAATAERMRTSGPRARVVELPGIGHAPWLMSEDQIALVRDFLLAPDGEVAPSS
jgi:pimeloyl-ACP methyl ester carboxylesterase